MKKPEPPSSTRQRRLAISLMQQLGDGFLDMANGVCDRANEDGEVMLMPLVIICAIENDSVVATTCHYSAVLDPGGAAAILRGSARALDAEANGDGGGLQ